MNHDHKRLGIMESTILAAVTVDPAMEPILQRVAAAHTIDPHVLRQDAIQLACDHRGDSEHQLAEHIANLQGYSVADVMTELEGYGS